MGQKIHPLGLRVGITKKHKAKWFANSDQYPQFLLEDILLRKLVNSLILPESLPRTFEDDKKMRVIEVQIERFLRNTIKIKIYAVNPDVSSLILDKKRHRDYSSEENSQKSIKKNRKLSTDKNSKKELTKSNENETSDTFTKWKNILKRKIYELKCSQFKNIIKKCNVLLEMSTISTKTKTDNNESSTELKVNLNTNNLLLKLKKLSEKRHRIQLFLQRTLTNKTILQLPTELDVVKMNLLYIYYNFQIYRINLEMFEVQHEILKINSNIFKKFGILSKKWFKKNNLRSIKRILKKFEKQFENLQNDHKIGNSSIQFLKHPEILLRNYLQNSLTQLYTNKCIKYQHRLENEYLNRFGSKLIKKRPIDLMYDLANYLTWHAETIKYQNHEIASSAPKNQKKPVYYFSYQQLGQKLYFQKKKNYQLPINLKNNQIKQKNIKVKKIVKRKIQDFMIDNLLRKNFSNISKFYKFCSSYQNQEFSELIKQLTLKNAFPKISAIEIIEVKQPSEYAVCLAYFITQKLEKRFSFRSVMKQAKRVAMQTPSVKGIKIQLSGRLNGAEIARTEWIREGRVPLQTLEADVDYSYKTAQTLYGIIGVKVWIFRKKTQY